MAVYTSTPLEARCRAAAVEQFISCSACRMNMMSMALASFGLGLHHNQAPHSSKHSCSGEQVAYAELDQL